MKVTIVGQPKFYFEVSLGLVKDLLRCSKLHYDGECQRASAPIGAPIYPGSKLTQASNGVLRMWFNTFETGDTVDTLREVAIGMEWNTLDLISKICENNMVLDTVSQARVIHFADQIRALYGHYVRQLERWKMEVEV